MGKMMKPPVYPRPERILETTTHQNAGLHYEAVLYEREHPHEIR